MTFLNTNLNITNFKIAIIGGGNIAYRKLLYILQFTNDITIISPKINKNIKKIAKTHNLNIKYRKYKKKDIKRYNILIVTANNIKLQKNIYKQTKTIPNKFCNCVDSKKYSNIIFPAIIKKDNLTITISTDGLSPAFAKQFKDYIETIIPSNIDIFLKELSTLREALPKGEKRMKKLSKKVKKYIEQNL